MFSFNSSQKNFSNSVIRFLSGIGLFLFILFSNQSFANQNFREAAVAMPDIYSAEVAEAVLKSGGNAVDAAVAAGFVLAVTYPEAGNLGGGGFMTLFTPTLGEDNSAHKNVHFLDYREKAPLAASRDMYLDENKKVIPYRSLVGYQASGVPGTVMGLWQAHQRFGSQPWASLLQPAIKYAAQGFIVSAQLDQRAKWFKSWIADKSPVALNFETYFAGLEEGALFQQPELAKTLQRIATGGAQEFYRGETAKLIVEQMQQPQDMQHRGLITQQDLQLYEAKWRQPVVAEWQGRTVVSAPPPSSGGVAIVQLLKMKQMLQKEYRQALQQAMAENVPVLAIKAHFYAELAKRVYADRAHFLGDPDFVDVPVAKLIADDYLQKRVQAVKFGQISASEKIRHGKIESPETTHFSIVDATGNAVSNTYTLNMPFGNGVVVEGAGFLMNDEMDDFSTKPGVANVFGVVGGKANEIAPQKRMLSSMSPTLLLKEGEVEMVVGTPGGSTIITSVFQTIVNVVEEGMSAQQAVDAIRVHHQLLPINQIAYNPELPQAVKEELEMMGYVLKQNNYMGDVQLLNKLQDGSWQAAADARGEGVAKVFKVD